VCRGSLHPTLCAVACTRAPGRPVRTRPSQFRDTVGTFGTGRRILGAGGAIMSESPIKPDVEFSEQENGFTCTWRLGRMVYAERTPGVFEIIYEGAALGAYCEPAIARCDARIKDGHSIQMFIDASKLSTYESEFRTRWGEWLRDNKRYLDGVHILFASKLIYMGIVIVNGITGGVIIPYSDRASFERARDLALGGARRVGG
jgi:hypothetical protein